MGESVESVIASLLTVLSLSEEEETSKCPLATFARSLRNLLHGKSGDTHSLCDAIAVELLELSKEEERINATTKMISLTHDKLKAEIARLEAQMQDQERRLKEVTQQKEMCRLALNSLVAEEVPCYVDAKHALVVLPGKSSASITEHSKEKLKNDPDEGTTLPKAEPVVPPSNNTFSLQSSTLASPKASVKGTNSSGDPEVMQSNSGEPGGAGFQSSQLTSSARNATSLLVTLRLPEVKESSLLHAIESYELQTFTQGDDWMSTEKYKDILALILALLKHLPESRPPVKLAELRLLGKVFQAAPSSNKSYNRNLLAVLKALFTEGSAIFVLVSLLSSVNDDVKCAVLECLSSLVCGTFPCAVAAFPGGLGLCEHARRDFLDCDGLKLLLHILSLSSSESVMECALVFLWGLLSRDEKTDNKWLGERPIRSKVVALGGLRAALDLLFTDSLSILENVCMVIGYLTRDDASKNNIREIGGLEKLIATLRHSSTSIKAKIAGAIWNCASNKENRHDLRNLGSIPALLELLLSNNTEKVENATHEFLCENVAGALWNLSVDVESRKQIVDYGGIPLLIQVMTSSSSLSVLENITGTLWNCSSSAEVRFAICNSGGISVLLSYLNAWQMDTPRTTMSRTPVLGSKMSLSAKVLENVAGTLRNCAFDDRFKLLVYESGSIELLLYCIQRAILDSKDNLEVPLPISTVEKLISTLWVLTTLPAGKLKLAQRGGIEMLVKVLESSSPVLAASANSGKKVVSLFSSIKTCEKMNRLDTPYDFFQAYFSSDVLQEIPSSPPIISLSMSIREMIVVVLRSCSIVSENRRRLIDCGAVRCLVAVVLDCYSPITVFSRQGASYKSVNKPREPSVFLKDSVSSTIWYLSQEDKVVPCEQGGLEFMCMLLLTPHQPATVLKKAVNALFSLTVNNLENKDAIRQHGGLHALVQIISHMSVSGCSLETKASDKNSKAGAENRNNILYIALLTIRNMTLSNKENIKYCGEAVISGKDKFGDALLHVLQHGSEECAKEVAMIIKHLCTLPGIGEYFEHNGTTDMLNKLAKSSSTNLIRHAMITAKHAIAQALP
ncbi:unnamed protein product [Phytomonas sp. EM1]|nr:unnamed protein product [Phytomonas sp. EM1]|eukprot:CCW62683.1 unnamed protein product [Phytomonas sp. isolate EM1]